MTEKERQIEKIMKNLECSFEEAKEILQADKEIEQGKKMDFDLPEEKQKVVKKMTNVHAKTKTVYNFDTSKRERKKNLTKIEIIKNIADFLKNITDFECKNVEITNESRQIAFESNENKYELTLVQKKAPKK